MGGFLGVIGSVAGGLLQSNAANKAAGQQAASAREDLEFQKETRDLVFDRLDPFYQPGVAAQNALAFEMGLGERPMVGGTPLAIKTFQTTTPGTPGGVGSPYQQAGAGSIPGRESGDWSRPPQQTAATGPTTTTGYKIGGKTFATLEEAQAYANANKTGATAYGGFQQTPGYQFQLEQGQGSVNALAGARGGLNSGATLQALSQFNQGLANQEYGNYLSRLMGMAGSGQNAAGGMASAAQNTASGVSNALSGIGNAQSAGTIGAANGIANGINNGIGMWNYQRAMGPQTGGGLMIGGSNSLFGGNSWG
jgi:hypothetical protein